MTIPSLSIGLPVYNGERYLPGALQSLLTQEFSDFELIISDNASTDGTREICDDFARKDRRIRYSRNETNIGATRNYNRVFQLSRTQYFKWASHDDECHPSFVRRCMETIKEAPASTVLVFSQADIVDENGRVRYRSPDNVACPSSSALKRFIKVLESSSFAHSLWGVIRSDALRKTRLMGSVEADHVLLGELAMLGELVEIPEPLYRMRRHSGCATEINRSAKALLAWHDPSKAGKRILLPHWERVYLEYIKGVFHVPASSWDRLRCAAAVPAVSYWRRLLRWSGPFRHRFGLHRKVSSMPIKQVQSQ